MDSLKMYVFFEDGNISTAANGANSKASGDDEKEILFVPRIQCEEIAGIQRGPGDLKTFSVEMDM